MTRRLWRSTFGLVAMTGCLLAIATLIVGTMAIHDTHEALELQLDHRIAVEVQALIEEGGHGPAGIATAIRRRDAARSTASLDYLLVDAAGRRLAGTLDLRSPLRLGYYEFLHYRQGDQSRTGQSLTTRVQGGAILIVAADRSAIREMDATLHRLFYTAFGTVLVLSIAAAWLVGMVTRRRLARIDRTALAIIQGDLTRRMPLSGAGDEFDRVSTTLNRMLDRIGGLMDNLRQVSSDVAHDLRTPLTRLHNRLEEALASENTALARATIVAATRQSQELLELFASLLRIAEVEGLAARTTFVPIALDELVEDMLETYRPDLEARDHPLHADIATGITVLGDRRLLQQAITNLLDNVLRHTLPGTAVTVTLSGAGSEARLAVRDAGAGVAPEDAARLFQRFARADRSRASQGHGLGLAMVAAVAGAHHGTAALTSPPGFGVVLTLPLSA